MADQNHRELLKEDYVEPRCVLCEEPYGVTADVKPVPQQRIIEKMNDYMSRRDYAGAERHLLYWLEEAKLGHDERGQLMVENELVGHFRKTGNKEQAFLHAKEALWLLDVLEYQGSISAGTTYVNVATACNAFGEDERALTYFEEARKCYENSLMTQPELLGGLYNNMALTCISLAGKDPGLFAKAYELYDLAMAQMAKVPNGELEQAITCLNIANAVEAEQGLEAGENRIYELVDRAADLLETPSLPRNGYYAFVCEKCVPTFSYYGYFAVAEELQALAEKIYAEN